MKVTRYYPDKNTPRVQIHRNNKQIHRYNKQTTKA